MCFRKAFRLPVELVEVTPMMPGSDNNLRATSNLMCEKSGLHEDMASAMGHTRFPIGWRS